MKHKPFQSQHGNIALVMLLLLALSMVILSVSGYVRTAARSESQAEAELKAARAAEAAIEASKGVLFQKADQIRPGVPTLADVTGVSNLSAAPTSLYTVANGYTFTSNVAVPIENGVPVAAFGATSNATMTFHYLNQVSVTYESPYNKAIRSSVTMQRAFTHQLFPLFQYAIFFGGSPTDLDPIVSSTATNPGNGILELNPGVDFIVGGRVHSNEKFYYGSSPGSITFKGIVTSVNGSFNSVNPKDPNHGSVGNNVTFSNGTPSVTPYKVSYISFPCSKATTDVNQTGPTEFVKMPRSSITPDPNARDREYSIAGLKIIVNSSSTPGYYVTLPGGSRLYSRTGSCASGTTHPDTLSTGSCPTDSCGFALLTQDETLIPYRKASAPGTYNDLYRLFDITSASITSISTGSKVLGNTAATPDRPILEFGTTNDQVRDYRQDNSGPGSRLMYCTNIDVTRLSRVIDAIMTSSSGYGVTIPDANTGVPTPVTIAQLSLNVPNSTDYGVAKNKLFWNGLVYIHDLAAASTSPLVVAPAENAKGIMLIDGMFLPTTIEPNVARGGGLTFATDHAAYIIGDYNTGGTPPVNSGVASASPTATGYTVRPAAVMADAVTILSNSWNTTYNNSATTRTASSTTVNAAILSGNVPSTKPGDYSGGTENFLRLLEAWTSSTRLTYYGSMICLFPSQYSRSPWNGNYYGVPSRNWYFEPTYNNPNKLPPGTPNIIIFSNGEWVRSPSPATS